MTAEEMRQLARKCEKLGIKNLAQFWFEKAREKELQKGAA